MTDEVQKYIDKQDPAKKVILEKLRTLIRKTAPLAQECMSYGVPAFKYNGAPVVMYAVFTKHIGIYPEPETIQVFAQELAGYKTAKGSITFILDKPIPYALIKKIVVYKYNMVKRSTANSDKGVQKITIASGVVHKVPKDLTEMLVRNPAVLAIWNGLTPLARNEWICYLISVKQIKTREKHLMRIREDLRKGKK